MEPTSSSLFLSFPSSASANAPSTITALTKASSTDLVAGSAQLEKQLNVEVQASSNSQAGSYPIVPSTLVTLGKLPEPSPVYAEPVSVNLLRDSSYKTPAAAATSQALMQSFSQLGDKKNTFSVSSLFSKVGALSRETNEYRNEVRKFYVPSNVAADRYKADFSGSAGTRVESVFLTIKTKDGDSIQIQMSRNSVGSDASQMQFSFVVDGELSEAEQKALEKLANKLGDMGDEFFRSDTTELRGLKEIDASVIKSFKFTLQRPEPETDSYVEQTYEFNVDEIAQTQHLVATDVRGYSVDIKSQLQTLAQDKTLEVELFQQYLDLIRRATKESDTPNPSKRFMMDAFESMFSDFFAYANKAGLDESNQPEAEKNDRTKNALAAFDSGMPDFTAVFRSPVLRNPGFYSQAAAMVLRLEQTTQVETNGDNLLIKQETRYEYTNDHFESFPKEYLDDLGGTYTYTTESESASLSRFLSMTNERVNNIWIEQDFAKEYQSSQFVNYKMVDQDNYSYSDRKLQEFAEYLQKLYANNQFAAVEDLLDSSKEKLFMTI